MHDPQTVAFDIKYPWRAYRNPKTPWERGYRESFITIWHVDPEKDAHIKGTRGDDTCGWSRPPTTPEFRDKMRKLGEQEFSTIWAKRAAIMEDKSYHTICIDQDCYGAVYWAWRRIKQTIYPRGRWNFGGARNFLTAAELEFVYSLANNPVDNLQISYREVTNAEKAGQFFMTVARNFTYFHRPWWEHPRWHFWHWKFQIHPLQKLNRFLFERCAGCGKGYTWGYCPTSNWSGKQTWHSECYGKDALAPHTPHEAGLS